MSKRVWPFVLLLLMLATACAGSPLAQAPSATVPQLATATSAPATPKPAVGAPTPSQATPMQAPQNGTPWTVEVVTFTFGPNELSGILTLPDGEGPHPAIVLITGSVDPSTGTRHGVALQYFRDHSRTLARDGYAVLRYDPPGVGQSTGEAGFESLDMRAEEAVAALHYLQSRPDIQTDRVGLWGISQGGWVIAMTAARYPQDVAFLISVSGSGVSVAEQQVHSIEAQSTAAGMPAEDVARAVLFGRLFVDWQLDDPLYREVNEAGAQALGDGPWSGFAALVYEPGEISPAEGLRHGIEIMRSIQDEPWAEFLYLKELYLPQMESIPPEQVEAVRALVGPTLLEDPKDYLTRVVCPVLAIFGEEDLLQPTEASAELYAQYLTEAGNRDFRIVVIPGEGHSIGLWIPEYAAVLTEWLGRPEDG